MSEFDSKALESAREVIALTRQEHIGGEAQLIAKIQLLFVDAMEYASPRKSAASAVDADDNFYSWFAREWHEHYQQNQYTTAAKQMLGLMAESAWRAGKHSGMLQSFGNSEQLNSPAVPDGWIKCSERLPDIGEEVAVYCPGRDGRGEVTALSRLITHTADNSYHWGDRYVGGKLHLPESISHWQPLPAAPKQESE